MTRGLLLAFLFLCQTAARGQATYWVFFTDKQDCPHGEVSAGTRQARKAQGLPIQQLTDAFPSAAYTSAIEGMAGAKVRVRSRWLNAVSLPLRQSSLTQIAHLPFV